MTPARPLAPAIRPQWATIASWVILLLASDTARADPPRAKPALRVEGRRFVDDRGRVVILRGVNLAGNSKVPPFRPIRDPRDLDPLAELGFNVIRLVVVWEALEPRPGHYDVAYLGMLRQVVTEAAARGLFTILDVHQDGFSRYLSHGSGDGFPPWAASPLARLHVPDNSARARMWPILMTFDPGMHRSFADFYADAHGVRTRYLAMLGTLARVFANEPGVIGYDLLNEPWGRERGEIGPLYRDAASAIRAEDPTAILFLEGHLTSNTGRQTHLPRPDFGNVAYAPHYYKPTTIIFGAWFGGTPAIDRSFSRMSRKAEEWNVPLFLGEFGAPARSLHAGDYVDYLYRKLDDALASGAQWNVTPGWTPHDKDGWNGEDFNILNPETGRVRPNFRPRAFPRAVAGEPLGFRQDHDGPDPGAAGTLDFLWDNDPARGESEIFLPRKIFPAGSSLAFEPPGASWTYDPASQILRILEARSGIIRLRIVAP